MPRNKKGYKGLSLNNRKTIFQLLFMDCKDGEVNKIQFVSVTAAFRVEHRTIKCVWRQCLSNMEAHLTSKVDDDEAVEACHLFWNKKLPLDLFPDCIFKTNKAGVVGRKKTKARAVLADITRNTPHNE